MICVFPFVHIILQYKVREGEKNPLRASWMQIKYNMWQLLNQKLHKLTTVKRSLTVFAIKL